MTEFEGKSVLISGGGSGIGLATAQRLVAAGGRVVLAGRSRERLNTAVKELDAGDRVVAVQADVASTADLDALFAQVGETVGKLDGVFANAGTASAGLLGDVSEEEFDRVVGTNFKGTYFTVAKAVPFLNEGASVVLNGSWLVHRGMAPGALYAASKAAVLNLARSLAANLAPQGIRVNAVTPGHTETEMFDQVAPNEQVREFFRSQVVLGKLGQPSDVAETVAFLLSAKSAYVTGQEFVVDGGLVTAVAA
ncbi:SDR family NAD(P)-dependent oxidoreductase [Amycolatopsis magusensis]|uniref:NAD(P)-dependent dehydrogenase (Short-subunit alcohol dehydrogenase family) n=1 Tax=Amycolatopsis magusensis TaxID=882444 RepID=A0ABS4PNQ3_9PSEU|nr:SDR family oxidoreductase [Amycolatopsis magusensis]MBP2181062.1 NAD(P)-dependent dehydrogenase (short-subunit alcohol dehydrogenase family) [Amycolatopsis magusensis]MDI5980894.1 SDR family oxidoreductase [Amycolatopsis magusensis]UJW33008.1 SDR family oxidoreductase [Saccharothrix sp. AJ9571]